MRLIYSPLMLLVALSLPLAAHATDDASLGKLGLSLDLSLPATETGPLRLKASSQLPLNLKRSNNLRRVKYAAELVYDERTGEDIKGGKLSIRIPFS